MTSPIFKILRSSSFANLVIRALSILIKFGFNIYLIKVLDISEYGSYVIFSTSILLCAIALGFDYYKSIHRKIVNVDSKVVSFLLGEQIWFYFFSYLMLMPIFFALFYYNFIALEFIFLFYIILVFEHINQEIFRFLNMLKFPLLANILLFSRSVLWSSLFVLCATLDYIDINIRTILFYWLLFQIITLIVSLFLFRYKLMINVSLGFPSFRTLQKGISIALPFFISTILLKINEYSSRYFLDYFGGDDLVGVFGFYSNITNVLNVLVFAGVTSIHLPHLVEATSISKETLKEKSRSFFKSLTYYTFGFSLAIGVFIYPLLKVLEKEELMADVASFYILLLSSVLLSFSGYFQNMLYVLYQDNYILKSTLFSAVILVLLNLLLIPKWAVLGAGLSVLGGVFTLLALNFYFYNKIKKGLT